MQWIAQSAKDTATTALEKRLWDAADQFRANSGLKAREYSAPVFGLIFLRFAEVRFATQRARLEKAAARSQVKLAIEDLHDCGLPPVYVPMIYQQKCAALFEHFYESYPDPDSTIYASAG